MVETTAPAATAAPVSQPLPTDGIFGKVFNVDAAGKAIRIVIAIVIGLLIVGVIVAVLKRIMKKRLDTRTGALILKAVQYAGIGLIIVNAFETANIDLTALLGAAGIAGIALGFAAQTSVSNFISGIFLMSEKTFTVGDVVNVDSTTGTVYSIDALSVKLRTFDNQLVRIPNETLIKTSVTNITRFPIRRLNIKFTVTYDTDIDQVKALLFGAATANPGVLRNPEPFFMVQSFGKDGIDIFFGVWFANADWEKANNGMFLEIRKRAFDAGMEFAHATMTVHQKKG